MKYLLTILIISTLSCNKNDDTPAPQKFADPNASNCSCRTFQTTPYTGINWAFASTVADPSAVTKLTLRRAGTLFPVFDIEKPTSKNYLYPILFDKCPTKTDNAFYFFEWIMKDGRVIKGDPFQVWE
jgi:hypothetical protein